MYADDCILFCSGNNWNIMSANIQSDLHNVHSWCVRNRLKLNEKKSKTLLFGSISKLKTVDLSKKLKIGLSNLEFVEKYCYLGVTLDRYMNLTNVLSDVKKKVVGQLFQFCKIRNMITTFCAVSIYKQTILPILDCAGFLLQSCNISDRGKLQVLQNDALRTCYNIRLRDRMSIKKLHNEAKLLSLEQRRNIQLLSLMYSHKDNLDVRRVPNRDTRAAIRYKFYTERYNNIKYKNSPYYKGAALWDMLPLATIECESIFELKKCLRAGFKTYAV